MTKQWGHGYYTGKVDALRGAAEAVERLQDREVYAMTLVHKLMDTHPDKALVDKTHAAILQARVLNHYYASAAWNGMAAGLFIDKHPPMSKKSALAYLCAEAIKHGWKPS